MTDGNTHKRPGEELTQEKGQALQKYLNEIVPKEYRPRNRHERRRAAAIKRKMEKKTK
jgi:hypothetical protein